MFIVNPIEKSRFNTKRPYYQEVKPNIKRWKGKSFEEILKETNENKMSTL